VTRLLLASCVVSQTRFSSTMAATQAIASGDLADLVSSSAQATIYPNDDALLQVLHARFRADLPYTRIGPSNLVVVNPYKSLANTNDVSAREYEERCYKDTSVPLVDSPRPLQPHLYELAAKLYLLMRRRHEPQAVVARSVCFFLFFSSGKESPLADTAPQRHHRFGQVIKSPSSTHTDSPTLRTFQERVPYRRPDPCPGYPP
jgi:hypothetical protein